MIHLGADKQYLLFVPGHLRVFIAKHIAENFEHISKVYSNVPMKKNFALKRNFFRQKRKHLRGSILCAHWWWFWNDLQPRHAITGKSVINSWKCWLWTGVGGVNQSRWP